MKSNTNGHAPPSPLPTVAEMENELAGLGPKARVKRLGELLEQTKKPPPAEAAEAAAAPSEPATNGDGAGPKVAPKTAPPLPAPEGRNAKTGRFVRGNAYGRGNQNARKMASLRSAFTTVVTPDRLRALAEKLYEQALAGDAAAVKVLLSYCLGSPGPAPDPDRLDLDEFKLLDAMPSRAEVSRALLDIIPVELACEFVQQALGENPYERMKGLREQSNLKQLDEIVKQRCRRGAGA